LRDADACGLAGCGFGRLRRCGLRVFRRRGCGLGRLLDGLDLLFRDGNLVRLWCLDGFLLGGDGCGAGSFGGEDAGVEFALFGRKRSEETMVAWMAPAVAEFSPQL